VSGETSISVVVVGTGTDVGKTHVTCALLSVLGSRGIAWKPIESGVTSDESDSGRLARAGETIPALHSFAEPLSPHLAARNAGVVIDPTRIVAEARRLRDSRRVTLIETAGGLLSPLDVGFTNADLVRELAPERVLLVAPDRLGVLHDVAATIGAARAKGVSFDAIVLSAPETPDASTGTNQSELGRIFGLGIAAVFERAAFDAVESVRAARETLVAIRC
jgi:dethiobiotin synthetase